MSTYEARRQQQIARNRSLLRDLGLGPRLELKRDVPRAPPAKRRKLDALEQLPTRKSSRLAANTSRPSYLESDALAGGPPRVPSERPRKGRNRHGASPSPEHANDDVLYQGLTLDQVRTGWSSWTPSAPGPTRDEDGTLHFADQPDFTPNKSPEEILREGCFGGSYFRPLYSKALRTTVADDWQELPPAWISGLNVSKYLTNQSYDPEVNKYGVACGQSIEEWEAAGWINHSYDVRGWFQWYCRFYQGRRCDDDGRQISRWRKCVGETGRWRRTLLKKYVALGIRNVTDEGDEGDTGGEVSPVVHQTCHHWAFEVKQAALDGFWEDGR